jgi:predicted NBD/HSP70 family sugar kinase
MPREKMSFRKKVDRVHQLPVHLDKDCLQAVLAESLKGPSASEVIRSCIRFALLHHKKEYLEYVIEEAEKTIKSIIEKQGKEKEG